MFPIFQDQAVVIGRLDEDPSTIAEGLQCSALCRQLERWKRLQGDILEFTPDETVDPKEVQDLLNEIRHHIIRLETQVDNIVNKGIDLRQEYNRKAAEIAAKLDELTKRVNVLLKKFKRANKAHKMTAKGPKPSKRIKKL